MSRPPVPLDPRMERDFSLLFFAPFCAGSAGLKIDEFKNTGLIRLALAFMIQVSIFSILLYSGKSFQDFIF